MTKQILTLLFATMTLLLTAENNPYRSDYTWVAQPNHADWRYHCGEQAAIEVQLLHYGMPVQGIVEVRVAPDMLPMTTATSIVLQNGRGHMTLPGRKKPGFTELIFRYGEGAAETKHHIKLGFDVESIEPWTKEPKDFVAFWEKNIKEQGALDVSKVTREDIALYSTDKVRCELLKIPVDKHHSVYAYLFMPRSAQEGAHPAVLCPPGAGVKTIKNPMKHIYYAEAGFIRMEMEIHGLDPRMTEEQFREISAAMNADNAYFRNGLEDKNRYYLKHVYLGVLRALEYLRSLPEWDGKNLIVQGNSQGGALSLMAAALDKHVTACAAGHPALTDMGAYAENGRTGGYPHFCKWDMLHEPYLTTMAYYDVISFCRHISCPVHMTWGYCDSTCPPTTSWAAYNTLKCEKTALITPHTEHWTSDATEHEQLYWIQKNLR